MTQRIDTASKFIRASPSEVYQAFADKESMQTWLPPNGMSAKMEAFDFREGGLYRVRLTYHDEQRHGKSSADSDDVEVSFIHLVEGERIEQAIRFESEDPAFAGTMRMTWTFERTPDGTLVTIRADDVPPGIRPEDHDAGLKSTLDNLASFVESKGRVR